MQNWLKDNAISIIIAVATLVSTYAVYGYRLQAVEERQTRDEGMILTLQSQNTDTLVALGKISTDIEYIKQQLNKIVP